ncbi:MAG TPA: type III-B CRISPR-associated protein Cas10/Cmr2 [Pyrodictium sp.]|nr:type III-B CRISPR-associated protein Cas10/Cmr2 [Pyrodictium sp.]
MSVEFWALKLVALLHDPVWKAWVINRAFGGVGRVIARVAEKGGPVGEALEICRQYVVDLEQHKIVARSAHEAEAYALAYNVAKAVGGVAGDILKNLMGLYVSGKLEAVNLADRFASTIERVMLGVEEESKSVVEIREFANIFNPFIRAKICKVPPVKKVCEFIHNVVELAKSLRDLKDDEKLKLLYQLLYVILEPLWYRVVGFESDCGYIPLADTRVPTHTVFDHAAATSMSLNLFVCTSSGKPSGYIVLVDVPGIQAFIGTGRKTRDLWAGSWLVSALVWATVKVFVEAFGPDIVLSPALSLNPFYIAHLLSKLPKKTRRMVEDRLPRVLLDASQPLMPGTVLLVLPPLDPTCNAVKGAWDEILRKYYKSGLDEIVSKHSGRLEHVIADLVRQVYKHVWSELIEGGEFLGVLKELVESLSSNLCGSGEAGEECRKKLVEYLVNSLSKPLLDLRVVVVDIEEAYREFMEKLREVGGKSKLVLAEKSFYEYLIAKVFSKAEELKAVEPIPYSVAEGAIRFSSWAYGKNVRRAYRQCSVCGSYPAVVYASSGDSYAKTIEILKDLIGSKTFLDEGEALCPICLFKRLIAVTKYAEILAAHLIGQYTIETASISGGVLSTSDVANSWWYLSLEPEEVKRILKVEAIRREVEEVEKAVRKPKPYRAYELVVNTVIEDDYRELYMKLYTLVSRISTEALEQLLPEDVKRRRPNLLYYAIVRGDGDRVGKKLWKAILNITPQEYVKEVCSATGGMSPICGRTREFEELVKLASKLVGVEAKSTLVTPAYQYSLSKALMATALVDALLVERLLGVLVYAGGDDIVALIPAYAPRSEKDRFVERNLEAIDGIVGGGLVEVVRRIGDSSFIGGLFVVLSRLNYWGYLARKGFKGFHLIDSSIVVPALRVYGRSYGVLIVHYRDHLYTAYRVAGWLEEEAKSKSKIMSLEGGKSRDVEADITAIAYGRLQYMREPAAAYTAILPNTLSWRDVDVCTPLILAIKLASAIEERKYSMSFIADIGEELERGIINITSESCKASEAKVKLLGEVLARLLDTFFERNATSRESRLKELEEELEKLSKWVVEDTKPCFLPLHVVVATRYLLAGRRSGRL